MSESQPGPRGRALSDASPSRAATLWPGLALATGLGAFGLIVSDLAGRALPGSDRAPVSPVMIGVLLGMVLRNLARLPEGLHPGLRFCATKILRLGIVLLGIRLSVFEVARLGVISLPVVVVCVASGVLLTRWLARVFSLPARLGTLIGVGTSICGVSAIAATGPVIRAEDEEVTYAIAVITVFGMLAMIFYPLVCAGLFAGDATSVGLFLGTAVHDTSQVNGAAIVYADVHAAPHALDVAVVTKLLRNLFMIAVIPWMAVRHQRSRAQDGEKGHRVSVAKLFPLFVVGFVLMAALRSTGDAMLSRGEAFGVWDAAAWEHLCATIRTGSSWCLVVALSAVGLGTDFRAMRSLRLKPFLLGLAASLAVGVIGFVVVSVLRIWDVPGTHPY